MFRKLVGTSYKNRGSLLRSRSLPHKSGQHLGILLGRTSMFVHDTPSFSILTSASTTRTLLSGIRWFLDKTYKFFRFINGFMPASFLAKKNDITIATANVKTKN